MLLKDSHDTNAAGVAADDTFLLSIVVTAIRRSRMLTSLVALTIGASVVNATTEADDIWVDIDVVNTARRGQSGINGEGHHIAGLCRISEFGGAVVPEIQRRC